VRSSPAANTAALWSEAVPRPAQQSFGAKRTHGCRCNRAASIARETLEIHCRQVGDADARRFTHVEPETAPKASASASSTAAILAAEKTDTVGWDRRSDAAATIAAIAAAAAAAAAAIAKNPIGSAFACPIAAAAITIA
jgi:hypothetical protein